MKIIASVVLVEDIGDHLKVQLQGHAEQDADWQPWRSGTINLPINSKTKHVFYIGRRISITVKPL